jgi:peptidoglycan/LPS O-acetylase OafA/YrhL
MTIIDIEQPPASPPEVDAHRAATTTPARPTPPAAPVTPRPAADATEPRWQRIVTGFDRPLGIEWGIALVVAWVVVMAVGIAVEPAPANPDAAVPLAVDLMGLLQMSLWGVMAAGVIQRRRYTAAASLAGAAVLGVMAIACPASGHHAIGAWWGVQMVGVAALLALSGKALRSSRD